VRTKGNPDGHVVLRGGGGRPNYSREDVARAAAALDRAGVTPRLMVDCSHDNSGKDFRKQPAVVAEIADQIAFGSKHVLGVMIESNLVEGRQDFEVGGGALVYGQSITDACVDIGTTEQLLLNLARATRPTRVSGVQPNA
jgi:3-deoxy-7-phosphoheptulonate synthase